MISSRVLIGNVTYVSASVSQERPRSNSLFAKSLEPEMTLGLEREIMLPERVGMLRV